MAFSYWSLGESYIIWGLHRDLIPSFPTPCTIIFINNFGCLDEIPGMQHQQRSHVEGADQVGGVQPSGKQKSLGCFLGGRVQAL